MPESPVPKDMAQSQGSDVFVILDLILVENVTTDEDRWTCPLKVLNVLYHVTCVFAMIKQ